MCSSKPICAVLKTQMCSHQINNNITSKLSSHLLVFLVDAPDARNAVIVQQNFFFNKIFSGRGPPDPHIFLTNHICAGVMEQKVKLGQAKLSKRN